MRKALADQIIKRKPHETGLLREGDWDCGLVEDGRHCV
jgi:hypothetical protein